MPEEKNLSGFLRNKDRTPEQKKALKEQGLVPGIFTSREEREEILAMTADELSDKVKELNQRLAESVFVGPPHRRLDGR